MIMSFTPNSLGLLGRILLLVVATSGCSQPYRPSRRRSAGDGACRRGREARFERRSVRLTAKGGQWEGQFVGIHASDARAAFMQLFAIPERRSST